MPRAKPKPEYIPLLWLGYVPLPVDAGLEMIEICGVPKERHGEFLMAVGLAIGQYVGNKATVDQRPRPANIVAALAPLEQPAARLLEAFGELDSISQYHLRECGFEEPAASDMPRQLTELISAVSAARERFGGMESRRSPTRSALRMLVITLGRIFRVLAEPDLEPIEGEPKLDPKRVRLDFVTVALEAARASLSIIRLEDPALEQLPAELFSIEIPSHDRLTRFLAVVDRDPNPKPNIPRLPGDDPRFLWPILPQNKPTSGA